jgi:hypothetical protein
MGENAVMNDQQAEERTREFVAIWLMKCMFERVDAAECLNKVHINLGRSFMYIIQYIEERLN